ncbi:MAG: sugar phosphate isomerase/epimerase [Cyclobacteriaceae bacterium]|nr:sugar phosphate isomerase/epimerase [Cyclobacteriaceae bacterium]MCK5280777.1 sugar phosphate isomerase/epimerase [Cyclobacteriaceae bacterium]MCK5470819.1 sugar phosphate isomerase/epimerase [Cyclobacteriaceae bacterium]
MKRRNFLKSSILIAPFVTNYSVNARPEKRIESNSIKLSLNAYSFNKELRAGSVTLFDLLNFCKEHGFDAIDPTGYYFPGYPNVPEDDYLFEFKRKAFLSGIEISGTGVRNDFANADEQKRKDDLKLIDAWCEVASKIGAPLLRVFPGKKIKDGRDKNVVMKQVVSDLKKACEIGAKHGVMIALQNHNDFLKSSEEIAQVINGVNSNWLGLHLDIGSLPVRDVYDEIQTLIKHAITWQIKEEVWENGEKVPVNYDRLMKIILTSDYIGYLPLETLSGDPTKKIPVMIDEIRKRL